MLEKLVCRSFKALASQKRVLDRAAAGCLGKALADLKEASETSSSETDGLRDVVEFLRIIEEEEDGARAKELIEQQKGQGLNVGVAETKWLLKVFAL